MKQFYKLSFLAIALLIGITAKAQESPVSVGVKVGANLSNFGGDGAKGTDAKFGYNVGVTLDYGFTPNWYLQTGLELTSKGVKKDLPLTEITCNAMYLQLPIHAAYKLPVMEGTNIVFHAGPYLAYGIGGKTKTTIASVESKIDTFGDKSLKEFDFGVGAGVGVEFGAIAVNLGYDFGLLDVNNDSGSIKTQNAYLSLGYKF